MTSGAPCILLDWDSRFFSMTVARVTLRELDEASAGRVMEWCSVNGVKCLYYLAPGDAPASWRSAEENGFNLVDTRITLQAKTDPDFLMLRQGTVPVREAEEKDRGTLIRMAAGLHKGTRFGNDPGFTTRQTMDMYSEWMRRDLSDPETSVLVSEDVEGPSGYITYSVEAHEGEIGLVGVHQRARGIGAGGTLVDEALARMTEAGTLGVRVVTQGGNVGAVRLYEGCGFAVRSVGYWFHRWFGNG